MIAKPENEKSSVYYNEKAGPGRSHNQSPFHKKLYHGVASFLNSNDKIVDLGCGAGRLLRSFRSPKNYIGIDFSTKRIQFAREAFRGRKFKVGDITKFDDLYLNFDTFVLVEVLEHINDDIGVIGNIPLGSKVVMANPNCWADAHVRKFESEDYIKERYHELLKFEAVKILNDKKGSPRMFIHKCRRMID